MEKFIFRGFMAPVFTPFKNNSSKDLNLGIIPEYSEFLLNNNIRGILVNGTSGEGMSMGVEERNACTEAWLNLKNRNKFTVMVQVGGAPLPDVLKMAEHAEKNKADAILCLPELYIRPNSPQELVSYLQIVSKAAPKTPLFYYHVPMFTGVQISMVQFLDAASGEIPTLSGLKFTSNNLDEGSACLEVSHGTYTIFLGADQVMLGANALGFDSAIATTLNMLAGFSKNLFQPAESKEAFTQRQEEQKKLNKIISAITRYGPWVPSMKAAMNILTNVEVGPVRDPMKQLKETQVSKMKDDLRKLGLNVK